MPKELSIVTSVYNEESVIAEFLEEIVRAIKTSGIDTELIVVNNGSRDKTGEFVKKIVLKYPSIVRAVDVPIPNIGKGNGLRTGISKTNSDFVAFIDGDGQQNPEDIYRLLDFAKRGKYDLVVGTRQNRQDTFWRKVLSLFFKISCKSLFYFPLPDAFGQPRIINGKMLKEINLQSNRWFLEIEMTIKVGRKKGRIGSIGVYHRARKKGKSKINIKQAFSIFGDLLRFRFGLGGI